MLCDGLLNDAPRGLESVAYLCQISSRDGAIDWKVGFFVNTIEFLVKEKNVCAIFFVRFCATLTNVISSLFGKNCFTFNLPGVDDWHTSFCIKNVRVVFVPGAVPSM